VLIQERDKLAKEEEMRDSVVISQTMQKVGYAYDFVS
jgi:hypothetical protein